MRRYASPWNGLPADAGARLRRRSQPEWIGPMLATLTEERFSRQGWLFEPKWDGERCLAFRRRGDLRLFSRNRILLNDKYPEITMALDRQEAASFITDGEIVTFKNGITSFAILQERMQVAHPSPDLLRRVPVWLYLFDLLYLDRYDTRQLPLRCRKTLLRKAFAFRATRFEGFKIACYDAAEGGHFRAHRDNLSPSTEHRRFALTLNLNDGYEGGHLRFPEYGAYLYRPGAGGAVVFSGSHLHEALPVTRGKRYVLLSFLFGEGDRRSGSVPVV